MRGIRSILAGFCFGVFGVGSLVFGAALVIFLTFWPAQNRRAAAVTVNRALWRMFAGLMILTGLIGVRGRHLKSLRREHGAVIVANHPSLIDVVLLVALIPKPVCVVKSALGQNMWMRRIVHAAHLVNDLPPDVLLHQATDLLNKGYNILIFPQGTRSADRSVFHRGAARLALAAGVSVRPVHIRVSPPILGKHQPWWAVSDHRVWYTLDVKGRINPAFFNNPNQTMRQNAARLTTVLKSQILEEKA